MVGKLIKPMVTTVAPTMPVDAANKVPTRMTAKANPPCIFPKRIATVSNKLSASPLFSNIIPINTKRGTDNNT